MVISSKTREQGGSVTTTIPAEVERRMGLVHGQDLYWSRTEPAVIT